MANNQDSLIEVHWDQTVFPAKTLQELPRLMEDPTFPTSSVNNPAVLTLSGMGLVADPNRPDEVGSCRRYLDLIARPYELQTGYDLAAVTFFEARCQALQFLLDARPSKISFVSDYRFSNASLADLPACLGMTLGDRADAVPQGSLSAVQPGWEVTKTSANSIEFTQGGEIHRLDFVAWGDLDGDGIDADTVR